MLSVSKSFSLIEEHQKKPHIKMIPLAKAFGVKVYEMNDCPDEISGMIRKDQGYAIYVNASHSEDRQRFTIAHEIGHLILHTHMIGDGVTEDALYQSGLNNLVEQQANNFAIDILMPWHLVREEIRRGASTVEELAKIFMVTNSTMSIRLSVPYETTEED